MSSVRRALAFSFAERYLLLVIALGSNMAIARMLTPEAIGIFSVSLAVIGIAQVMRDFGVANYLIQERDLSDAHIRTAFGITLVLGGSAFVALFLAAPLISRFYAEPAMVATLRICALNFLALPSCTVSLALLRRELAFKRLAMINLLAAAIGAALSIGLAYLGLGVISLAIGSVAVNVTTGAGAWWVRRDRRLLLPSFSEWRRLLNFGAQSTVAGVVTTVSMDINDLAVGKIMGFEPVAILSRAQGLMNLFHRDLMSAIRNVSYPAFAQANRDRSELEPMYITSVAHVTALAWPFYGFASLYALEILRLLFGPQWDAAAPLVPVFCLAGALAATSSLIASIILAVGRVDLVTWVELVFQPFRAALIVIAALVFKSMMACAIALVLAFLIHLPLLYVVKGKCLPNDYRSLFRRLAASIAVALVALIIPATIAIDAGLQRSQAVAPVVFLLAALSCAFSWALALILLRHPLAMDPAFLRLTKRWGRPRDAGCDA